MAKYLIHPSNIARIPLTYPAAKIGQYSIIGIRRHSFSPSETGVLDTVHRMALRSSYSNLL